MLRVGFRIRRIVQLWHRSAVKPAETGCRGKLKQELAPRPRVPLKRALEIADNLLNHLGGLDSVVHCSVAGSLRRRCETVKDIDLIVASTRSGQVTEAFLSLPWKLLRKCRPERLETKVFTLTPHGIDVDLWIVPPEVFGVALCNRTGSSAYLEKIYKLALQRIYGAYWTPGELEDHYSSFAAAGAQFKSRAQLELFLRLVNFKAGAGERLIYQRLGIEEIPPHLRD